MKTNQEKFLQDTLADPIAIVGMSCRFPQANTLQEFWDLLCEGKDTITEMPSDRWDITNYYDSDPEAEGKTNQRHASFLKNIHDFDPFFFNISPAEATEMSPSQKLMLELVWEAIENSSIAYKEVQGRKIGVYVGNIWSDFEHLRKHKNAPVTLHSAVGQSSNIIANRVSFNYGFTGPSLVIDTGCSSSLVALNLACQSLRDNSEEMSIVAGINHILDPDQYVLLSKFGGLSSKGRCCTFDVDGDGFVRGEGAGVLLLKRLSAAEKAGDKIYAVIRGTAVNNNGYNVNLPATSVAGQKQVLHEAYLNSGINPAEVHYVEAHGTGTKLGDPTESQALGEFFGKERNGNKLRVGSVKTNIGHLEAAAGIAGLIKVVLAMQNKQLPPSLHYKTPNPAIPFEELKLEVQSELSSWPVKYGETLKAGINSFGWGGTNAHAILEEYKVEKEENRVLPAVDMYCLPISARSEQALKDYVKVYAKYIGQTTNESFHQLCASTAILKPLLDHRILFSARDKSEMMELLEDFLQEEGEMNPPKTLNPQDKVVLVFPGQGSQWLGMGKELFQQQPVFRKAIEECEKAFSRYTDWSLINQLFAKPEESRMNEIRVIQPTLCAVQIALARLWMSFGVIPHAVVGHSMGEVAAAHISGALNLDDAARIICTRSQLMNKVSGKGGAMAVTELTVAQADEVVKRYPELSIAVNNSPKSTVLAGDQQAISRVLIELENKGLFARQVKVDVASHSQQMDPLKFDLHEALQYIGPLETNIPLYSTVRGKAVDGPGLDREYWVDNLRETVQFATVIQKLIQDDHTVFIEVSPHPVLLNAINECAEYLKKNVVTIASVFREKPEQESIYKNLGELYAHGYTLEWKKYYQVDKAPDIALPSYPFQRERYELEDKSHELQSKNSHGKFAFFGSPISLAGNDNTYYWETQLSLGLFPYLQDHQVNETPVLPGAAYVEMVLEAANELYDDGVPVITHLQFIRSITLSKEEVSTVQLRLTQHDITSSFQFFVKVPGTSGKIKWEILAEGELKLKPKITLTSNTTTDIKILASTTGEAYYASLKSLGLQYGNYFQGLKELKKMDHPLGEEIHFKLMTNPRLAAMSGKYKIHPAVLDACFQPLFYSAVENENNSGNRSTFLTEIGEVELVNSIDHTQAMHGVAKLHALKKDEQRGFVNVEADIIVYSDHETPVLKISGLKGKIIDTTLIEQRKEKLKNWLYKINWVKRENVERSYKSESEKKWIIFGDPYGVSDILVEKMRQNNFECIHITPANGYSKYSEKNYAINYGHQEDYAQLMKELFIHQNKSIDGILHIGSMSYTWQDPYLTADVVEQHQIYGSVSFMYLHQQLTALKLSKVPSLVIVTNGIQTANNDQNIIQPVHSPLWGMVKVMFNELTHFNCRYFDLSANPAIEELDQIITQLHTSKALEHEIAFRGTEQYVPRLCAHHGDEQFDKKSKEFSSDGTYLVTGFRGLGFVFIEWMVRQGARNFALVSRSGEANADVHERIKVLESQGCRFRIFAADAGVFQEIKKVTEEIELSMPPLKGVIHAAGVIEARTLTDLSQNEFLRILNPKVKGAWNLHLLTQHKSLDCFIMFSSASTLIGLSGQGSYVAANAFLDTLAYTRQRMGLPGMSINWGVMKDVGMVANKAELEKYAKAEGFEPVSMHDAMEVFHAIYDNEHTQIGIVKMHPETMANYYSVLSQTPYFKSLLTTETKPSSKETSFIDKFLLIQNKEEREKLLEELVIQLVAKIVKTSTVRIKPAMTFKGLGIDSLMAIQLRNLLQKQVNLKLSVSMFWAHPSIHEYAQLLNNLLAEQLLIKVLEEQSAEEEEDANPNHWFVTPKPNPEATFRLFCFHDGGGNASLFHAWPDTLNSNIELVAVELPGRGRRMAQKPYFEFQRLINDLKTAIIPLLDKPFLFFGHSMGGLIAFELTRELRKSKQALPLKLFVSSTPGLTTYTKRELDYQLNSEELIHMFPHLDKANIGDDELQQLLIDLLRADLRLLSNYSYVEAEILNVPIVAIRGVDDERVRPEQIEKWQDETNASCKTISRPGGHRYVEHDVEFLTSLIGDEVNFSLSTAV